MAAVLFDIILCQDRKTLRIFGRETVAQMIKWVRRLKHIKGPLEKKDFDGL